MGIISPNKLNKLQEAVIDETYFEFWEKAPAVTPLHPPARYQPASPVKSVLKQEANKANKSPFTSPSKTTGRATWYCCTRGYSSSDRVAAAGPALRKGNWRGRWVMVYYGNHKPIRVRLVDWCACKGDRIIDLHPGVFDDLAPLSAGVINVRVKW